MSYIPQATDISFPNFRSPVCDIENESWPSLPQGLNIITPAPSSLPKRQAMGGKQRAKDSNALHNTLKSSPSQQTRQRQENSKLHGGF